MIEREIISDVADIYGITVDNILSRRRIRRYVDARAVVCYLLCFTQGFSTTEVGEVLNRSHSSIVYFNKKTKDWLRMPILNDRGYKAIKKLEKRYKIEDK